MIAATELADWLAIFKEEGGHIAVTCNGTGVLASNKLGKHFFSLAAYSEADVDLLIDVILPYL